MSLPQLKKIVIQLKPASCPTNVLWETIGPNVQSIINSSLTFGVVPTCFRDAVVHPRIKRSKHVCLYPLNFRLISKLPFMAKILAKTVFLQLQFFIDSQRILETSWSHLKAVHSTESALSRFLNDLLLLLLLMHLKTKNDMVT